MMVFRFEGQGTRRQRRQVGEKKTRAAKDEGVWLLS